MNNQKINIVGLTELSDEVAAACSGGLKSRNGKDLNNRIALAKDNNLDAFLAGNLDFYSDNFNNLTERVS